MRERKIDGRLQVIAAMSFLNFSRLVRWDINSAEFTAVPRDLFESAWRREVDPVCGRLICWINFSAGAEFLAKGVCLLRDVEVRKPKNDGTTDFGTLGQLYRHRPPNDALKRLCAVVNADNKQQALLLDAYKFLASDIRNRDAHAYVPNVRDNHFAVARDQFVPCFNFLISWLREGQQVITKWMEDAPRFVASLK
jgi:hypothetical protein